MNLPPHERFRLRYSVNAAGCWIWNAPSKQTGYGEFFFKGKVLRAHRYSWAAVNGPIPDGLCVCHRCDVPACVNPEHLFLGTHNDNVLDKIAKGRQPRTPGARGEKSHRAKLAEAQVRDILRSPHLPVKFLAAKHAVSVHTIAAIRHGAIWNHVFIEEREMARAGQ